MASKPLTFVTWNACSVRAKAIELADFLRKHNIDVGLLTETHLKSGDSFWLPDYNIIRLDRTNSRGGGVAVIVKAYSIQYLILPHIPTSVIEALSVEVKSSAGVIRFIAVYCPRQCVASNGLATKFKNDLASITRTKSRFVVGDLNARHEAWRNYQRNQNGRLLFDHVQLGLYTVQFADEPTFISPAGNPSTLDFFLSNIGLFKPVAHNDLSSDHQPVVSEVGLNVARAPCCQRKDYHRVNWVEFGRVVDRNIDENSPLNTVEDINRALERLNQAISVADETCIRRVPVRGSLPLIPTPNF